MEAGWFKSGRHRGGLIGELSVVVCLSFCRRDIPDGLQQSVMVEPSNPFEGSQLHRFLGFLQCSTMDQFGLVQPIDRFGQGLVITASFAAYRGCDVRLGQSLAVADAHILRTPVRMMDQCPIASGLPGVQRLLQRVRLRKSPRIELLTLQPTIRRANTSMTNAT